MPLLAVLPITLLFVPAYAAPNPIFRDEKALALLKEMVERGSSLKSLSADVTMTSTGAQTLVQRGKLFWKAPKQGRIELKGDGGQSVFLIADGTATYSITETTYTNVSGSQEEIWPFLTGIPGADPKELTYAGTEKVGDIPYEVLERKQGPETLRVYISPEKVLHRLLFRVETEGQKREQEILLTNVQLDGPIPEETFKLPAGLKEQKSTSQQGVGALEARLLKVGTKAPAFNLANPSGGTLSLAQALKGKKAVLVNFWFIGCPPCREEHPELQKLYAQFKAKGFGLVGINQGDDSKAITDYLKKAKLTFPAVKGVPGTFSAYGVQAFPTNYLLDGNGKVVYRSVGFNESALKAALTKLGMK